VQYAEGVSGPTPPARAGCPFYSEAASTTLHIGHNELSKSLFPDTILKPNGVTLRRPA